MSDTPTTGFLLDGVFASQAIDSSGEVLDIKGMDVSDFDEGKGLANYEHQEDERSPKTKDGKPHGDEIVGKVIYTKKIFKEDDCSNDRERLFWKRTKLPFLYGVVRLYDAAGHDGAKALAASIRDSVANNEPIIIGFSIEGTTLEKKGNTLKSTIGRLVALTKKPCNKQAISGILADPHAPDGFSKNPENAKTYLKTENPLRQRLGGSETVYDVAMLKAMSAGSYNASPSTLTGGAALQVEDKTLKSMAMAAKRDWDKTGKFKDYLKSRLDKADLGDVSDEFLNHYSDMVEAHHYKIKKSEEVVAELKKAGKLPKVAALPKPKPKAEDFWLTNNGVPVKPNKKVLEPKFDENSGTLHMPHGSFKVYIPGQDHPDMAAKFHQILNDPKVDQFHNYAMENWSKAHQLLKAGKLPPEVAMHSVLFSNLSPNTPVPMQEHMYGHLVDSMNATKQNPLTGNWADVKQDWLDRDQPQKFPDHSPEHWKRLEGALRLKNDSKTTGRVTGRVKGDIGSFMLANDKFDNMTKYKDMHAKMQDLLQRHKGDSRSAVEEMMFHKNEQVKWNNRRRIGLGQGKPDMGDYPGMSIAGLAPKTARYALAMMGGGNIHVPDTHFTRNLFGLNRNMDTNTIQAIKNVMWEPRNSHILSGIDRYYAKNHPAVEHMVQHPKWGHLFANREDAVFPAFWKHWMAIVPHEQARGHKVNGYNELTDHRPFWEAIAPYMKKTEGDPSSLPMQTAKQHAEWQLQYGELPAMMMYYRHLLPQLLGAAAQRQAPALVHKMEELQVEILAKATRTDISRLHDAAKAAEAGVAHNKEVGFPGPKPAAMAGEMAIGMGVVNRQPTVTFQNRTVKTGKATVKGDGKDTFYHLVGHSPTHLIGVENKDNRPIPSGWDQNDLVKIPRDHPGLRVTEYPETQDEPNVVNADIHGVPGFVNHPETRALAHGFDFGHQSETPGGSHSGIAAAHSFWGKDPTGKHVYVKGQFAAMGRGGEGPWNTARKEGAYHNIAKDFFGMGKYVPNVAVVRHPATGQEHAIIQHVEGGKHGDSIDDHKRVAALQAMNQNGDLHKSAAMNFILNNRDRHSGNWLYTKSDPKGEYDGIKLIDHNLFGDQPEENGWHSDPWYLSEELYNDPQHGPKAVMHPEAQKWLQSLDANELRNHLMKNGMPPRSIEVSVNRLNRLKEEAPSQGLSAAFRNASSPEGVKWME